MFAYPERLMAWRYMRSRRREGFISVISLFSMLGIMLGVATLILVTSLMNGIREEMLHNFIGIDGHVTIYGYGKPITESNALIGQLKVLPGVQTIIPRVEGQVMLSSHNNSRGGQVIGIHKADLMKKQRLVEHITQGSLEHFDDEPGVVIGQRLMESLGLRIGDSVTLISPQGRATFAGSIPRIKAYPIIAAFELGMHALDSNLLLMPFDDAAIYFTVPKTEDGAATAIEITVTNQNASSQLAAEIAAGLDTKRYRIYDWQQSNAGVLNALTIQRNVMFVILALIILVATFNIISSLIMLVQDKTGDIAILRTIGATRGAIQRIFLLTGMASGIVGTVLGLVLGLLAAEHIETLKSWVEAITGQEILVGDIYFLSTLPTRTDPMEVAMIIALALALSFVATLYPSWKAASTHPAEALRYE